MCAPPTCHRVGYSIGIVIFAAITIIAGLMPMIVSKVVTDSVSNGVVVKCGELKSTYLKPAPITINVYFFNITNLDQVLTNNATINVKEIGPYSFSRSSPKFNVSCNADGSQISSMSQDIYTPITSPTGLDYATDKIFTLDPIVWGGTSITGYYTPPNATPNPLTPAPSETALLYNLFIGKMNKLAKFGAIGTQISSKYPGLLGIMAGYQGATAANYFANLDATGGIFTGPLDVPIARFLGENATLGLLLISDACRPFYFPPFMTAAPYTKCEEVFTAMAGFICGVAPFGGMYNYCAGATAPTTMADARFLPTLRTLFYYQLLGAMGSQALPDLNGATGSGGTTVFTNAAQGDYTSPNAGVFMKRTPKDLLFGYKNPYLDAYMTAPTRAVSPGQYGDRATTLAGTTSSVLQSDLNYYYTNSIQADYINPATTKLTGTTDPNKVGQFVSFYGITAFSSINDFPWLNNNSYAKCSASNPAGLRANCLLWDSTEVIAGTNDGTSGMPINSEGQTPVDNNVWVSEAKRVLNFKFTGDTTIKGINVRNYQINPAAFQSSSVNPANAKYFMNEPTGVVPMTAYYGREVMLTKPHFLGADASAQATVTGLSPNANLHETYLQVDPITGITFSARKRLQVNAKLNPATWNYYKAAQNAGNKYNPYSATFTYEPYYQLFTTASKDTINNSPTIGAAISAKSPTYVPLYWIEEAGDISDSDASAYVSSIYGSRNAAYLVQVILCPICSVVTVALIVLFVMAEQSVGSKTEVFNGGTQMA